MTKQQITRTAVVSLVAAGAAFFTVSWDTGMTEAIRAGGAAFFATAGSMLGYLRADANRRV